MSLLSAYPTFYSPTDDNTYVGYSQTCRTVQEVDLIPIPQEISSSSPVLWDSIRNRATLLYGVVQKHSRFRGCIAEQVWLALLGGEDEDVWLWNDGDEDLAGVMISRQKSPFLLPLLDGLWRRGEDAFQQRGRFTCTETRQNADMRYRIQSASFPERLAAIFWLVMTSKVYQIVKWGFSDMEQTNLWEQIWVWHCLLKYSCGLDMSCFQYRSSRFRAAMTSQGHTCHYSVSDCYDRDCQCLEPWLYIRSLLFPERKDDVINLMRDAVECPACNHYALNLPTPPSFVLEDGTLYQPSPYLVFLFILYEITRRYPAPDFEPWLLCLTNHPSPRLKTLLPSGPDLVNSFLSALPSERKEICYLPWVNLYPDRWRYPIACHLTLDEWRRADSLLSKHRVLRPAVASSPAPPCFMAWIGAVIFCLLQERMSDSETIFQFLGQLGNRCFDPLRSLPEPEVAINFREAVERSPHTCWERFEDAIPWYAAAMSVLHETDNIKVVGLHHDDDDDGDDCVACRQEDLLRAKLFEISSELGLSADFQEAIEKDDLNLVDFLRVIVYSDTAKQAVLGLQGEYAQGFVDVIQDALDKGFICSVEDKELTLKCRRLLVKVSETRDILPSSLFIHGVQRLDQDAAFGGSFGDIFRATYQGKTVALKRIRVFQTESIHRTRRQFCREALLWQRLRHSYVLPFIGIDSESFPSFLGMVSPWMNHGTILRHLKESDYANVELRLFEVAQGLAYLHSQNIVHGDLRGSNILVDDNRHAVLADFGLAVLSDATATTRSSHAGSVRWMAPELNDPQSFGLQTFQRTFASDVYAFACVCLELYTGKCPFAHLRYDPAAMLRALAGERPARPSVTPGSTMSDHIWNIVELCWNQYYYERPSIGQVIEMMQQANSNLVVE